MEINRDQLGTYNSSQGVTRSFCKSCGTPMAFETDQRPDEIDLYAATLDDHSDFTATKHVFWNERVSWLSVADGLPKIGFHGDNPKQFAANIAVDWRT